MSRIIRHIKCDNCGWEKDVYISFGEPDHDIDFQWKCEECECMNHVPIKAWPWSIKDLGWIKLSELEGKTNEINM